MKKHLSLCLIGLTLTEQRFIVQSNNAYHPVDRIAKFTWGVPLPPLRSIYQSNKLFRAISLLTPYREFGWVSSRHDALTCALLHPNLIMCISLLGLQIRFPPPPRIVNKLMSSKIGIPTQQLACLTCSCSGHFLK